MLWALNRPDDALLRNSATARTMKTYSFTVACAPAESGRDSDQIVDALYEAGCDDALVVERAGAFIVEFDREAATFAKAIFTAFDAICRAGLRPVRIEPDPLVSAAEIAERSGLTRAAISNYVKGARGQGFPIPAARLGTTSPLWQWTEVMRWLQGNTSAPIKSDDILFAHWIDRANDVLPGVIQRFRKERQQVC